MAVFNKFQDFSEQLARGVHDFDSHVFKILLSEVSPVASNTVKANLTELPAGNGYPAGGSVTTIGIAEVAGVTSVTGTQVVFAANGGSMGPFRYAILYNDTSANDPLIGWWDYSSSVTLSDSETLTVKFGSGSPGVIFTLA